MSLTSNGGQAYTINLVNFGELGADQRWSLTNIEENLTL